MQFRGGKSLVSIFALCLALNGCERVAQTVTQREIKGSLFLIKMNGESAKLGRVAVSVYDEDEVVRAFNEVKTKLVKERIPAEKISAAAGELVSYRQTRAQEVLFDRTVPPGAYETASEQERDAEELKQEADAYVETLESAGPYFMELQGKKPIVSVKTDADGNFQLQVPRGKRLVVTAWTELSLLPAIYYWAVRLPATSDSITLSDDNLAFAQSRESLLHVQPMRGYPVKTTAKQLQAKFNSVAGSTINQRVVDNVVAHVEPTVAVVRSKLRITTPEGELIIPQGSRLSILSKNGEAITVAYLRWKLTITPRDADLQ
jgi:hypothetical protein